MYTCFTSLTILDSRGYGDIRVSYYTGKCQVVASYTGRNGTVGCFWDDAFTVLDRNHIKTLPGWFTLTERWQSRALIIIIIVKIITVTEITWSYWVLSSVSAPAEEHVHVRVRLLRQHRRLPVYPHHPPLQSHHCQEEHPCPGQVSVPSETGGAEKRGKLFHSWKFFILWIKYIETHILPGGLCWKVLMIWTRTVLKCPHLCVCVRV